MINWRVRVANRTFWVALIPAILMLIQTIGVVFGIRLDLGELGNNLLDVVNAVFVVLAIVGIVTDPTTKGLHDSDRAMTYSEPN